MASRDELTNKGPQYGHNVSHSKRRTNRVWKVNLQKKTIVLNGKKVKVQISANTIRTLKKKGVL